jgi:hypothetical protein
MSQRCISTQADGVAQEKRYPSAKAALVSHSIDSNCSPVQGLLTFAMLAHMIANAAAASEGSHPIKSMAEQMYPTAIYAVITRSLAPVNRNRLGQRCRSCQACCACDLHNLACRKKSATPLGRLGAAKGRAVAGWSSRVPADRVVTSSTAFALATYACAGVTPFSPTSGRHCTPQLNKQEAFTTPRPAAKSASIEASRRSRTLRDRDIAAKIRRL